MEGEYKYGREFSKQVIQGFTDPDALYYVTSKKWSELIDDIPQDSRLLPGYFDILNLTIEKTLQVKIILLFHWGIYGCLTYSIKS